MKNNQLVSIIMPAYNSETYIEKSIESILSQTYKCFEFIIINDGSTDKTRSIIKKYKDPRINLIDNNRNLGLSRSVNKGLKVAKGMFIARHDSDDISLPTRIHDQINFLIANPSIGLCGTWAKIIGKSEHQIKHPVSRKEIQCKLFFNNTFVHSSLMFRKKLFDIHKLEYDTELKRAQDYSLLTSCSFLFDIANIPKILVMYRKNSNTKMFSSHSYQRYVNKLRKNNLKKLSIDPKKYLNIYKKICLLEKSKHRDSITESSNFLTTINHQNKILQIYPVDEFELEIIDRWSNVCSNSINRHSPELIQFFTLSPSQKYLNLLKRLIHYSFKQIRVFYKLK